MTGPAEMVDAYVAPRQNVSVWAYNPHKGVVEAQPLRASGINTQVSTVMVTPTQVRRPWRATIRSGVQMALALATLLPFIVTGVYQGDDYPVVVGQVLGAATIATRVMALPQVEKFLQDWAPWLAAAPAAISRKDREAAS